MPSPSASRNLAAEPFEGRQTEAVRAPVLGWVGAGQLARMSYGPAVELGLTPRLLAADPGDSAALVAADVTIGAPSDPAALEAFAEGCDVVTFDHELVDLPALERLEARGKAVRPSAATLRLAADKGHQRATLARLGLPVPVHRRIAGASDLVAFGNEHGWPVVAKAVRGGYDGRGVWVLGDREEAAGLAAVTAAREVELLAEEWLSLERELAVLIARRPGGEAVVYPVVETVQRDGMLQELVAPARVAAAVAHEAVELAREVADAAGAVGILAVEMFVAGGKLLVNELATRPHNSGHFSIEGARTSQFENHVRAVLDWPLGDPSPTSPAAATVNVIGGDAPPCAASDALAVAGAHVHLYGKAHRPGRKLGHVTVLADHPDDALARARRSAAMLSGPNEGGT